MKIFQGFVGHTLVYLLNNLANSAIPFLLLPFLIRELGPQEYGRIGLISATFGLIVTLAGLGAHAYVRVQYNQRSREELGVLLGNAVFLLGAACCAIYLAIWVINLVGGSIIPLPASILAVCISAAFGQSVITIRLVLWQMANRPMPYGALMILITLSNLTLSLVLVFAIGMRAEGRILGMWLPAMLVGPLIVAWMYRRGEITFRLSQSVLKEIAAFGLPLIPHSLALSFIVFFERFVLSNSPDAKALGIYFTAFQLSAPITIFVSSVNLQFRAWSDRNMARGAQRRVVQGSYGIMLTFFMAAIFYAWILQYFYSAIVGENMGEGYGIAVILIFSSMFKGFYLVVAKGVQFAGRTSLIMIASVSLAISFSIALLFFNQLHIVAWLNVSFNALLFLSMWIASAIVYPQPWLSPLGSDK
jgi:O-antigen/teichoic acid export membrane protein